jgi:hypothetical protein
LGQAAGCNQTQKRLQPGSVRPHKSNKLSGRRWPGYGWPGTGCPARPCRATKSNTPLVSGQLTTSPTSSLQEGSPQQVSASHEKSPPRTTSPRLRLVRGPGHTTRAQGMSTTTDACGEIVPHAMQVQQLAAMQGAHPDKSLNAGLTGCAASHHHHLPLGLGHSSTLYDAHEPRLRLKRGGLVKYSGRLRQTRTTWRRRQASQDEQSHPATRRLPQPSTTTQLQCVNQASRLNFNAS